MRLKVLRGFDVRTGPDNEDSTIPTRRVAEAGDVITLEDVPEWKGAVPQSEIDAGVVEIVEEGTGDDGTNDDGGPAEEREESVAARVTHEEPAPPERVTKPLTPASDKTGK